MLEKYYLFYATFIIIAIDMLWELTDYFIFKYYIILTALRM